MVIRVKSRGGVNRHRPDSYGFDELRARQTDKTLRIEGKNSEGDVWYVVRVYNLAAVEWYEP